ncbi:uncharacterized protein LOC105227631 isoform X2 [Bactrocera dorsalis]|uniref:Uncharacterized protein LOC105227631 isoform X2 n=1 Tax=Bactrocera dorsalis TaxID=27457 RepID=A0ABM3IYN0_BACDO|nr:uncharacterized protein LOC105227631 isoform X2 [Bactrocera dorsalis]
MVKPPRKTTQTSRTWRVLEADRRSATPFSASKNSLRSNADVVTAKLECDTGNIWLVAAYMPHDEEVEPPPALLRRTLDKASRNGADVIIGSDTNSRLSIWGSSDTNTRDDMKKITHGRRTLSEYHSKIGKGLNLALSKIEMSGEQGLASMLEYVNQETGLNSRYTTAHYIVITRQWEHVVMTEGDITQMCRDNTTTNYAKNQWREDQQAAKRGKIPSSKNYNSYKVQRDTKIYNHSPTEGRNKEVLC